MRQVIIDNRYKVLKKLGSGAMGDVYKVRDLKDKRVIALKMLSKERTTSEAVKRFKREFKLLAGLHHPNLCLVYDFGILKDGRSYFTMEYIDGKDIFKASKGLPYKKIYPVRKNISNGVYPWIVQLCRVLEYIHSKGLIHYDIKPSNVLIAEGEEQGAKSDRKHYAKRPMPCVKLMDFGLVGEQRIKGGVMIKGTFPYIAPEVIKGLAVDQRADLYSLGVLLYEVFTHRLFRVTAKESFVTLLKQRGDWVLKLPSKTVHNIPKTIDQLILRLLASEPSQRYSRANEVIREINKVSRSKFEFETEKTLEGYLLSSRFVGRTKEMTLLKSLYEQARQGEGKVVLVTGDAGIGKTRLLKEFKISAQLQRSHCFTGSAFRDKVGPLEPFYGIFKELINYIRFKSDLSKELKLSFAVLFKLFPDLADEHLKKKLPKLVPLEPKQEKLRTFEALSELIKYIALNLGELVISLEDLHWADDLSIQFLEYLGRNLEDRNVFICGSCSKEELKGNLILKRMMVNLKNEDRFSQIQLGPLRYRSLYSFLDSTITSGSNSSELVRYLMKKTGGNPFFVQEIMRTLLQKRKVNIGEHIEIEHLERISIPETIEEIVLKRIKGLDSTSQKVVKFGAVLLKDFSYALMKLLTGIDDTELSRALWELKRRQILVEEANRYRFYHATLREAVNKRMAYSEKRKLYYRSGKTLEHINKGNTERVVEELAYYFIKAKDSEKGVKYGLRAAKKSTNRYANEQTITFYKGVLSFLSGEESKRHLDSLKKLACIEARIGYYDDAIKNYNRAIRLKTISIDERIRAYLRIGSAYIIKGKPREAITIFNRAGSALKKRNSDKIKHVLRVYIDAKKCKAYQMLGEYKSANKINFEDFKLLRGIKSRELINLLVDTYSTLATIELRREGNSKKAIDKAIFYRKEASKYSKELGDQNKIAATLINIGFNYYVKFDFKRAFTYYSKAIRLSQKIGNQYFVSTLLFNLGNILRDVGRYSKALDNFQRSLHIAQKTRNQFLKGNVLWGLGTCHLKTCSYKSAKEYSEKAFQVYDEIGIENHKIYPIEVIGAIHQAMGNYDLALKYFRKSLRITKEIGPQCNISDSLIAVSSVLIEIGQFAKAKSNIEDALKIATSIGTKDTEIRCYFVLCRFKIMIRDYDSAISYYKKGMELAEKIGLKHQILQFYLLLSEICYSNSKYLKGVGIANKAIKLAKEMGTKNLYVEALLIKAKNDTQCSKLSKIEIFSILNEASEIAEEIDCPEILWKVYFEYGRLLQDNREYYKALESYQRCIEIFMDVSGRIKKKLYKESYLNRPDRQTVFTAINGIEKML